MSEAQPPIAPRVVSEPDAARYLGVSVHTIRAWRRGLRSPGPGGGPRWFRLGRSVRYDLRDLDLFISLRD